MTKAVENKAPLLIISLVAVDFCFRALQMRKLEKEGYYLWLVGEILPWIGSAILYRFSTTQYLLYFMVFPIPFIILYTVQRKHLSDKNRIIKNPGSTFRDFYYQALPRSVPATDDVKMFVFEIVGAAVSFIDQYRRKL